MEIEFTIHAVGNVQNAVVIGAKPRFIFDRSTLKTIRKGKYNPEIETGVPVARPRVMARLRFDHGRGR